MMLSILVDPAPSPSISGSRPPCGACVPLKKKASPRIWATASKWLVHLSGVSRPNLKERQRERETATEIETETETEEEKEKERQRQTVKERQRDRERQRQRDIERDRDYLDTFQCTTPLTEQL